MARTLLTSPRLELSAAAAGCVPAIFGALIAFIAFQGVMTSYLLINIPWGNFAFGLAFAYLVSAGSEIRPTKRELLRFAFVCLLAPIVKFASIIVTPMSMVGSPIPIFLILGAISGALQGVIIAYAAATLFGISISRASYMRIFCALSLVFTILLRNPLPAAEVAGSLVQTLWFLPLSLLLAHELRLGSPALSAAGDEAFRTARRLSNKTLLLIAALPFLLMLTVGIISDIRSYDGNCYGFTDGKWPCSMWESIQQDMSLGMFFLGIPCLLWAGMCLLLLKRRGTARP